MIEYHCQLARNVPFIFSYVCPGIPRTIQKTESVGKLVLAICWFSFESIYLSHITLSNYLINNRNFAVYTVSKDQNIFRPKRHV